MQLIHETCKEEKTYKLKRKRNPTHIIFTKEKESLMLGTNRKALATRKAFYPLVCRIFTKGISLPSQSKERIHGH